MAKLRRVLVGIGLSTFVTGCANIGGISGYDNVDDLDASSPDVGGDTSVSPDTAVAPDTGAADTSVQADAADTGIHPDADAADVTVSTDADAADATADPCAGVTCNTPPAPTCANPTTQRTYASTGMCSGGTCTYAPTDTSCPANNDCIAVTCVPESTASIAVGDSHACARRTDGSVVCWGRNNTGQIGDGTTTSPRAWPTSVLVSPSGAALNGAAQLAAGNSFSCARRSDGTIACWGSNWSGQIGDGTTTDPRPSPTTVRLSAGGPSLTGVAQVALGAGSSHACARKTDGTLWCWGSNSAGQIGDGTTTSPRLSPTQVLVTPGGLPLTGVTQVAVGSNATCARKMDGTVACWGGNGEGELGDGTTTSHSSPSPVLTSPGGTPVTGLAEVYIGNSYACARKIDGTAVCWGFVNSDGMVGNASTPRLSPTPVLASPGGAALTNVAQLALAPTHTCARKTDGSVVCWGKNDIGQVGDGTTTSPRMAATQVLVAAGGAALAGVSEIASGDNAYWGGESTCARRNDTTVYCWGTNTSGQIGDGTTTSPRPSPTLVPTSPSCLGGGDGRFNCGPAGNDDCCASPLVPGGTFSRSYDGVTTGYTDPQYKATVSDFRLDKYEVTVGRFRQFVNAVVAGWTPPAGSGKHTHLNGGSGLLATGGGYEGGWDATWSTAANLPNVKATWDTASYLGCNGAPTTWTSASGTHEKLPINCISWYQANAFCIWDGGFLPSETEWNYAAAAGAEQRAYPWGATAPGANATLADYGCFYNGSGTCSGVSNIASVGLIPAGVGKWGQMDLAGNVWEWNLDWYVAPFPDNTCVNCTNATTASVRGMRGGAYSSPLSQLPISFRNTGIGSPWGTGDYLGVRCARSP